MDFFFNELSIHGQFSSTKEFKTAVDQFRKYRTSVVDAGFKLFVHRKIFERPVLGADFRKVLRMCFKEQQRRALLNWLSKAGSYLPDEAYAAPGDKFICHFPKKETTNSRDVTDSAISECAFRWLVYSDVCTISLEDSEYDWSPIHVEMNDSDAAIFENDYCHDSLAVRLEGLQPEISTWEMLIERIERLHNVSVEHGVLSELAANPFANNVAKGVLARAKELEEMSSAQSREEFNELRDKYASGGKAHFSDSSEREKLFFKEALSFVVDGNKQLCPYHGKVKIQQYRIHILNRPTFNEPARIVYIGPKLTRS